MTSMVSWLGVDQRGPASLYLAADSRFAWPDGHRQDGWQKTFVAPTTPDIFAFCGHTAVPGRFRIRIEGDSIHRANAQVRHAEVLEQIRDDWAATVPAHQGAFTLLHGARELKQKWYRDNGVLPASEGGGTHGALVVTTDDPRTGFDTLQIGATIDQLFSGV